MMSVNIFHATIHYGNHISLYYSFELNSDHVVDSHSMMIFPVAWCESNSYPLLPPKNRRREKVASPSK